MRSAHWSINETFADWLQQHALARKVDIFFYFLVLRRKPACARLREQVQNLTDTNVARRLAGGGPTIFHLIMQVPQKMKGEGATSLPVCRAH